MTLPYSEASSGTKALAEVEKLVRALGASNYGVMNDWEGGKIIVQFTFNGQRVHLEASWRGYAAAWLKENPWSRARARSRDKHEALALHKGEMAVPSILRDWLKGQMTAVKCGLMSFDEVFMPHLIARDGRRLADHVPRLLELEPPRE